MTSPQTEWGFCQVLVVAIGSVAWGMKIIPSHIILRVRESLNNALVFQITCKCIEQTKHRTKDCLEWKAETIPFNFFSQTFSFGLEHFERIIKSPLFGSILEVRFRVYYKLPKFYNKSRMQDSHHQGDDFSNPGPLSSPEYPYDQRPRPQQKKTGRVLSQVSLEVGSLSTGRIEQGKCMVFLELFTPENFSDCCIR